jgi:hypothetical protein
VVVVAVTIAALVVAVGDIVAEIGASRVIDDLQLYTPQPPLLFTPPLPQDALARDDSLW